MGDSVFGANSDFPVCRPSAIEGDGDGMAVGTDYSEDLRARVVAAVDRGGRV
jgi:hypothetical protein